MTQNPKYPDIAVKLTENDGNAFMILGQCQQAMRRHYLPETEIKTFMTDATSGDYNHLLMICLNWLTVE